MNSEFTKKLNLLRELLSEHTSAQVGEIDVDDTRCPKDELGACCQAFGCVDGSMQDDCTSNGGTFHKGKTCSQNPCGSLRTDRITDVGTLIREYITEDPDENQSDMPVEPMMPMG